MATLGASAIVSATPFFASGPVGWVAGVVLIAGAALLDQKLVSSIQGKPKEQGRAPNLVGLPSQDGSAGSPRIWAIGRRIRVPAHVLWQSEKVIRAQIMGGSKGVPGVSQNQTLVDCALAVNDRETERILQMMSQGQLLFWTTRNIVTVETSGMVVSESGGNLVLTMVDNFEPDFTDKFLVDDNVVLSGFVSNGGPNINVGHWRVVSVTAHGETPSQLTLSIYYPGQSVASLAATAGSTANPASVSRLDDALARHDAYGDVFSLTGPTNIPVRFVHITFPTYNRRISDVLSAGDLIALENWTSTRASVNGIQLQVYKVTDTSFYAARVSGDWGIGNFTITGGTSTNSAYVRFWGNPTSLINILPSAFVPSLHFHRGTETQTAGSIIEGIEGVGNVPGYRGVAYQELEEFNVTRFGGGVGPQTEALIEPDQDMTWPRAFALVCERGGIPAQFVNTEGVSDDHFEGMYLRGSMPAAEDLQGMLLAKQVATQDRDGVFCFAAIENLDVVQVVNGESESDLGAIIDGDKASDDKLGYSDASPEDAPTSVGVRHQDPDNFYEAGYQVFGVRNPSASTEENRTDIDLSNIAMTRRQAMNLATTVARRMFINARTVRMQLPIRYAYLLENDLVTVTTDEGDDITIRVVRRDIGSNWLIQVTGVEESVDVAVSGSPVQTGANIISRIPQRLPPVTGRVLDMPPIRDYQSHDPGFWLTGTSQGDGAWAGATVYRSTDAEASWQTVATLTQKGLVGVTETALASGSPSETHGSSTVTWDAVNSVTVEFDGLGQLPLATTTAEAVLDGWNWLLLEAEDGTQEIIGARDVVQNTATNYTFSYLLRGLRGTAGGIQTSRAIGSRVTGVGHLEAENAVWLPANGLEEVQAQSFRFAPPGEDVSDAVSVSLSARWRNCLPFPVRSVTKAITGTTSVRFTVDHWTRRRLDVGSTGPYPLDEPYEEYRIELWNASGTGIVHQRTITSRGTGSPTLRDKWVDFSSAECTTAGYTLGPGATFYVNVVQIGDYGESPINLQNL